MNTYIRLSDKHYPAYEQDIRSRALPKVLPAELSEALARKYGFALVSPTPQPQHYFFQYVEVTPEFDGENWNQTWVADDGGLSLHQLKEQAVRIINTVFQEKADQLAGHYPLYEKQTWDMQQSEATAYQLWEDGGEVGIKPATPTLDTLCSYRGDTVTELSAKVLQNKAAWTQAVRHLSGARQKFEREILAAANMNDIVQKVDESLAFSL